jgi:hypothetical protein
MQGKTIDEIKVGDWAEFSKTISEADVYLYSGMTGDMNPALAHIKCMPGRRSLRAALYTVCSWAV